MSRARVSGKTAMPRHSAVATGRSTSSAVLRGKRYGGYQQQERRNVNWTLHTLIICPIARGGGGI